MAVTIAGTALKKMTHNGQTVKKWVHEGVRVYSAAETFSYDGWSADVWTYHGEGTKGNTGALQLDGGGQLAVNITPTGQWAGYTCGARTIEKVDLTGYKSITVDRVGGGSWPSSSGHNRANIFVREEVDGDNVAHAYLTPDGSTFPSLTLDVSDLSGYYYVFVCGSVYNGSATSAQYNFRAMCPVTFTALE